MDPASPLARRFPLIPRPRPPCTPLAARVAAISELAGTAARTADLAAASAAFNQAALLASDCGQPGLARRWCHRHARAYLRAFPLPAPSARRALEPLVNLARLHIRASNGDAAFSLLDSLYHAVATRTATTIDGITLPADNLAQSPQDHHDLLRWLWTVHLSDSPRALISAGRWQEALTHLQRHNGIGQRMLDGRQVAVITHCTTGDTSTALRLLDQTAPSRAWEHAVTACLTVLCRQHARQPADPSLSEMLDSYQQLLPAPRLAVFHTRLGLSVVDAAQGAQNPQARAIASSLIDQAARDGYAAREILAHPGCNTIITSDQELTLTQLLNRCALGHQDLPASVTASLTSALDTSEEIISRALPADPRSCRPYNRSATRGKQVSAAGEG